MNSWEKLDRLLILKSEMEVMESKLRGPLCSEKERFNNWNQRLEDKTGLCFTPELGLFKMVYSEFTIMVE